MRLSTKTKCHAGMHAPLPVATTWTVLIFVVRSQNSYSQPCCARTTMLAEAALMLIESYQASKGTIQTGTLHHRTQSESNSSVPQYCTVLPSSTAEG